MASAIPITMNLNLEWTNVRSGWGVNALSVVLAVALHSPLFFMKLDMHKPIIEHKKQDRLLEGIDIIKEIPKPEVAPSPTPVVKKETWRDKLAHLVKKDPPPPPPPPKPAMGPDKLVAPQNQIALAPKLDMPKLATPKMESKKNFQAVQPKVLEDKKIDLKPMTPAIAAPLTQGRVGYVDKGPSKTSRESFAIAKNTSLSSIGQGPSIADPLAPTIAIQTGKATQEGWSAAPPSSLKDKGKGNFSGAVIATPKSNMTLREQALAQANARNQIELSNSVFSQKTAASAEGMTSAKKDAGSYQGGGFGGVGGGVPGGVPGGTGSAAGSGVKSVPVVSAGAAIKPKEKKSMFQITGPLKDRPIEKKVTPEYPSWAKEQGIEASVVLEFVVTAEGYVKDNIVPIRSSGYTKLDESAMKALKQWKFSPLPEGNTGDQVGRITFNYQIF